MDINALKNLKVGIERTTKEMAVVSAIVGAVIIMV
jgi:hypothetical protein